MGNFRSKLGDSTIYNPINDDDSILLLSQGDKSYKVYLWAINCSKCGRIILCNHESPNDCPYQCSYNNHLLLSVKRLSVK